MYKVEKNMLLVFNIKIITVYELDLPSRIWFIHVDPPSWSDNYNTYHLFSFRYPDLWRSSK